MKLPTGPLEETLARVGDRWSLLIIDGLTGGPLRYKELQEALPGLATNVLAQRLKHLEAERVVLARPYQERPRRYSYELTAAGQGLAGALSLLAQWGIDHGSAPSAAPEHQTCGSSLEVRWYCPTCDRVVGEEENAALSWL
jgi:DNA-binding HxlR family transcriptional regulator